MNTAEFLTITNAIVPDRIALAGPDERLTYGELQSRVNRLAQSLQARGVKKVRMWALWQSTAWNMSRFIMRQHH